MHSTWIQWFSSYKKFDTIENIKIGDGKYIQVIESGSFLQEKSMRSSTCNNRRNTGRKNGTDHVCKLNRSLYSLKQTRCWNHRFTAVLKKHDLTFTSADLHIYK